jgi:hypothetical protein
MRHRNQAPIVRPDIRYVRFGNIFICDMKACVQRLN